MRRVLIAALLSAAAGCSQTQPDPVLEPPPPGLASSPRWLTFRCVEPGCDTTLRTVVTVVGTRDLAVKRIVLSDMDRTDFVLTPDHAPPFVLKTTEALNLDVKFDPNGDPRLGDVNVIITYTDASASETDDRVPPGELEIPLVRRLIGEPAMMVSPLRLEFGAVLVGQQKTLPLTISNVGFGNVGLVLDSITSDLPEISVQNMPAAAILPTESWDVNIIFTPTEETFSAGTLTVRTADPLAPAPMIPILATSIPDATLGVTPDEGLDFGELAVGTSTEGDLHIENRGAAGLWLYSVDLINPAATASITLTLPHNALTASIAALQSIAVKVHVTAAATPGPFDTRVRITSNASAAPELQVPVIGLVTEPNIVVTPASVDFGRVPRGWAVPQPVEIENDGYGDLVVDNVSLVLGSSELFNLRTLPTLPARLRHGQRIAVEVEFRSEAEATFNGTLSIDSNDPDQPYIEIPFTAIGASCNDGCPIANGTPSCTTGVCAIESCNAGFYDSDLDPSTGCECTEVGSGDAADFCAMAPYLGSLDDGGSRATYTGIIPTAEDVDYIRVFALDETQIFSDDFDFRITMQSADPGIEFCVYRYDVGNHETACILDSENCVGASRFYRKDGDLGPDDSADFTVKVFRTGGQPNSCIPYTLFFSNG